MEVVDPFADAGGQEAGGPAVPLLDEAIMLPHYQEQRQRRTNSKEMVNLTGTGVNWFIYWYIH